MRILKELDQDLISEVHAVDRESIVTDLLEKNAKLNELDDSRLKGKKSLNTQFTLV